MLEADSHPDGKRVVGGCFAVHGVYRKGNYGFPSTPHIPRIAALASSSERGRARSSYGWWAGAALPKTTSRRKISFCGFLDDCTRQRKIGRERPAGAAG